MKEEAEAVARSYETEKDKYLSSINSLELELRSFGDLREDLSQMRLEHSRTIEEMKIECDARGISFYDYSDFFLLLDD